MKPLPASIFIIFFITLLPPGGSAQPGRNLQHPLPPGYSLHSAFFADANTGCVAGDFPTVIKAIKKGTYTGLIWLFPIN